MDIQHYRSTSAPPVLSVVSLYAGNSNNLQKHYNSLKHQCFSLQDIEWILLDISRDPLSLTLRESIFSQLKGTYVNASGEARGKSLNTACTTARGRIILFLSSDLHLEHDLLETHLKRHDTAVGQRQVFLGPIKPYCESPRFQTLVEQSCCLYPLGSLLSDHPYSFDYFRASNVSISREVWEQCEGFDDCFSTPEIQDQYLGTRLWEQGIRFYGNKSGIARELDAFQSDRLLFVNPQMARDLLLLLAKNPLYFLHHFGTLDLKFWVRKVFSEDYTAKGSKILMEALSKLDQLCNSSNMALTSEEIDFGKALIETVVLSSNQLTVLKVILEHKEYVEDALRSLPEAPPEMEKSF